MRIVLLGLEFAQSNLGCQALAYSFVSLCEKNAIANNINVEYTYVGFDYSANTCIPDTKKEISFLHIQYKKISFWKSLKNLCRESDLIVDFTGGDSFSDIYGIKRFVLASLVKQVAINSATPFMLGPQTYGPYKHRLVRMWASEIIRNSKYVFARDDVSQKYAIDLTHKTVYLSTDVAFSLPYDTVGEFSDSEVRIGINPSGLLWHGGYSKDNQFALTVDYREYCNLLLERLLEDKRNHVYLIPHVGTIKGDGIESDINVCRILHERYPETTVVENLTTPMEAKRIISSMDVFLGARMHATIASFSAGVPTIPFSYSRKFEGLYGNLNYPYVIHATEDTTEESVNKSLEFICARETLKNNLFISLEEVHKLQKAFADRLSKILCDCNKGGK